MQMMEEQRDSSGRSGNQAAAEVCHALYGSTQLTPVATSKNSVPADRNKSPLARTAPVAKEMPAQQRTHSSQQTVASARTCATTANPEPAAALSLNEPERVASLLAEAGEWIQSPANLHAVQKVLADMGRQSSERAKLAAAAAAEHAAAAAHAVEASRRLQAITPAEQAALPPTAQSCLITDRMTVSVPQPSGLTPSAGPGAARATSLPAAVAAAGMAEPPRTLAKPPGLVQRLDAVIAGMQSPAHQTSRSTGLFLGRGKAAQSAAARAPGVPAGVSAAVQPPATQDAAVQSSTEHIQDLEMVSSAVAPSVISAGLAKRKSALGAAMEESHERHGSLALRGNSMQQIVPEKDASQEGTPKRQRNRERPDQAMPVAPEKDAAKEGTPERLRVPQRPDQAQPAAPEQAPPDASGQEGTLKQRHCPALVASAELNTASVKVIGVAPDRSPQAIGSTVINGQPLHSDRWEVIDLTSGSDEPISAPQPHNTSIFVRSMQCLPLGASAVCTDALSHAVALNSAATPQLAFDPSVADQNSDAGTERSAMDFQPTEVHPEEICAVVEPAALAEPPEAPGAQKEGMPEHVQAPVPVPTTGRIRATARMRCSTNPWPR
ncbi:g5937 [Coccomyxa elongata]